MSRRGWIVRAGVAGALVAAVAACAALTDVQNTANKALAGDKDAIKDLANKGAQAIERVQSLTEELTPENEYWVGRSVGTNILAKSRYLYRNKREILAHRLEGLTAYVSAVGQLVAAAALETPRAGDRPAPLVGFHFTVIEGEQVNAFAAPGGFIFVTTAAVRAAQNEDELAAVLAHEVAHVVRGHALGSIKKSRYADLAKDTLKQTGALDPQQLGQLTDLLEKGIDDMLDAMLVKGYSRDTELEADALAVRLTAAAGYDPHAMLSYLATLRRAQGSASGGIFQTHPPVAERVAKATEVLGASRSAPIPKIRVTRFVSATKELRS